VPNRRWLRAAAPETFLHRAALSDDMRARPLRFNAPLALSQDTLEQIPFILTCIRRR
jgi:hypothetical protein